MNLKGDKGKNYYQREWLYSQTNGSFALGRVDRLPVRKYHGLWVSRQTKSGNPQHFLLDVLDQIYYENSRMDFHSKGLSQTPDTNRYFEGKESLPLVNYDFGQGAGNEGRGLLTRFEPTPLPCWTYELQRQGVAFTLQRSLDFLTPKELCSSLDGVKLTYELSANAPKLDLSLEMLYTVRSIHNLSHANLALNGGFKSFGAQSYLFTPYPEFTFLIELNQDHQVELTGNWYEHFFYKEEKQRGYPSEEDCFSPCRFTVSLLPQKKMTISISLFDQTRADDCNKLMTGAKKKAGTRTISNQIQKSLKVNDKSVPLIIKKEYQVFFNQLCQSARSFSYEDPIWKTESMIAGFPWFSSWARDTFISLPGMSLAWNDPKRAMQILKDWVPRLEKHFFRSKNQNEILPSQSQTLPLLSHDVNCSGLDSLFLWGWALNFICEKHPGKEKLNSRLKKELLTTLNQWMLLLFEEDCETMQVTDFGLLCKEINGKEKASSWMDAVVDGVAVTPRFGYPIDINFMFFNNLKFILCSGENLKKETRQLYQDYLNRVVPRYAQELWNTEPHREFIADGHDGFKADTSLRPNQLWALISDLDVYTIEQKKMALKKVGDELATPKGLRTLAACDSRYQSHCEGRQAERDRSYHQGTVWPWLVGIYVEACLRILPRSETMKIIKPLLVGLQNHYKDDGCINQIAEIFDGEFPHKARGAPAQAWSIAELVRALWLIEN